MARLERFDAQSDQKILALTDKSPSPDNEGAVRMSVEMPWGEVFEGDVDKLDFRTATAWCEMVRRAIDARFDSEAAAEERRAARAQSSADKSGVGAEAHVSAGATESVASAVPAPQAALDESEPPREALARSLHGSQARLTHCLESIDSLKEEAATLTRRITALTAALEVLDASENAGQDDRSVGEGVSGHEEGE